jgi:hypothetical protein
MPDSKTQRPLGPRIHRIAAGVTTLFIYAIVLPSLGRVDMVRHTVIYGWQEAVACLIVMVPGVLIWIGTRQGIRPAVGDPMILSGWVILGFFLLAIFTH